MIIWQFLHNLDYCFQSVAVFPLRSIIILFNVFDHIVFVPFPLSWEYCVLEIKNHEGPFLLFYFTFSEKDGLIFVSLLLCLHQQLYTEPQLGECRQLRCLNGEMGDGHHGGVLNSSPRNVNLFQGRGRWCCWVWSQGWKTVNWIRYSVEMKKREILLSKTHFA